MEPSPVYFDDEEDGCDNWDCEDGWILNDCFEDTCCCLEPAISHGYRPCPACNSGGHG